MKRRVARGGGRTFPKVGELKKTMSLRAMLLTSNRVGSSRLGQIQHRENTRDIDP